VRRGRQPERVLTKEVASVLSKKLAAGSTHALIDIPVGATAKVRSAEAALILGRRLIELGRAVGLEDSLAVTDGRSRRFSI
ncbi:MAG: hypothetical protein ABIR26_17500, partial [Ramlibacter sp.]